MVAGSWNLAILTPNGIRQRLLRRPEGTVVEVQVSLERQGPMIVRADGLLITPTAGQLIVSALEQCDESLLRAAEAARNGIASLAQTPFVAAGINIRHAFERLPESLSGFCVSTLDPKLADLEHDIRRRTVTRSVVWHEGFLNIEIGASDEDGSGFLALNFHRASSDAEELSTWLGRTTDALETAKKLKSEVFGM